MSDRRARELDNAKEFTKGVGMSGSLEIAERLTAVIRPYLALMSGSVATDDDLQDVAAALDQLVAAYNDTTESAPGPLDLEPPSFFSPEADGRMRARFAKLGLYHDVDLQTGDALMGDAVSDLSEIASDLLVVLWWLERGRVDDAVWEFRFGYRTHWGAHLHDVRRYLHVHIHQG